MSIQSDLFDFNPNTSFDVQLPEFPSAVRYYDDFERNYKTLLNPHGNLWTLHCNGSVLKVDYNIFDISFRDIIKLCFCDSLSSIATTTLVSYCNVLRYADNVLLKDIFEVALLSSPPEFSGHWNKYFLVKLKRHEGVAVRHILHWLARWEIAQWRQSDADLIRDLPGHEFQKYKSVRDGVAGVDPRVASKISEYIDSISSEDCLDRYSDKVLQNSCVLALCMQHGLRRRQISLLRPDDLVSVEGSALHIRITHIKQRNENVGRTERRRIHDAWVPIFIEWKKRCQKPFLFGRPDEIGKLVRAVTKSIAGISFSPQAFRHSGAQRLVDGGFSRETVSAYLGHADVTAANYYFDASPAQNDLVNAALGKSDVYRAVAAARRGDMLTAQQFMSMPSDYHIAGMPHGVPISGIGACQSGQSLCARNPVIACYTCHKFLPLRDTAVHVEAKSKLEAVVMGFSQPSSVQPVSPAMMQLRVTMNAIQNVIDMAADDE